MKNTISIILFLFVALSIYSQKKLEIQIDSVFENYFKKVNTTAGVLQVYSESKNIDITIGKSKNTKLKTLVSETPFYTASITKMFTAASIGILKEKKLLSFEDKIHWYLPKHIMKNLHVLNGKDYSKDITISHLLQHSSGLPDYFSDKTVNGTANILDQIITKPDKNWLPLELITFTKENMTPHFSPSSGFSYTDTGYVLLALLVEKISGMQLHSFFDMYILQPLQMNNTYLNLKTPDKENSQIIMPFYASNFALENLQSLSADWGGGGLVATSEDLIQFLKAYNNDVLFSEKTRTKMQSWIKESVGMEYGFGIRKVSFAKLMNTNTNLELIGHTGSTASFLWYCPQLDIYISGSLNQLEASKSALILVYEILTIIENANL